MKRTGKTLPFIGMVMLVKFTNAMGPSITPEKIKTLALVQKVIRIADEVTSSTHVPFPKILRTFDTSQAQTDKGVYLYTCFYPDSLATPWGKIQLYAVTTKTCCPMSFQHYLRSLTRLFQRIPLSFKYCDSIGPFEIDPEDIERPSWVDFWKHRLDLESQDYLSVRDSQKIIVPLVYHSLYALKECESIYGPGNISSQSSSWDTLPPDFLPKDHYRPHGVIAQELKMLTALYPQETTSAQ